ncbi:hypothetical protein FCV38_05755 [Clostridium sporogenes]|nr:hypothetical protein [Clostridium sporogenes]
MGIQPTNAGIDFQQRVSAWFIICMLFEVDIENVLNLNINSSIKYITFESNDKIDDLVITSNNNKKIYMQMKRTINLSENEGSEFYSVCQQFVYQYLQNDIDDFAYILVTSKNSSNNISETLRRLLEGIRISNSFSITKEFNKNEQDVFRKIDRVIKQIYLDSTGKEITEKILLEILRRTYVEIFDIENGQSYEKVVKLYLYNKINVDVNLFWSFMIKMDLQLASARQTLNKKYLDKKFEDYLKKHKESNDNNELISIIGQFDSLEVRKDYILALQNQQIDLLFNLKNEIQDSNKLYLIELFRFNEVGKKELRYEEPYFLTLTNGIKLELVYRSATAKGIERFISSKKYKDRFEEYDVVYIGSNDSDDENKFEKIHNDLLLKYLNEKSNCLCSNCGKAIFQEDSLLIEIDNDNCEADIGIIHKECLIPVNRVLGIAKMPSDREYKFLKNFDINLWIKQIKDGQFCYNGAKILNQSVNPLVVETDTNNLVLGSYCVKTLLEDGTYKFATRRGNIDRYSKKDAEDFVNELNEKIKTGQIEKNPICYSSKSFIFGNYTTLVSQLGGTEEYIECKKSEVVKYNESIAKLHNKCKNFYTPLIYLVIDEKPLIVNDMFPLFTNPLELNGYLDKFEKVNIKIKEYQVAIIRDDKEFCLTIMNLMNQGIRPIIDIKFGKNNEIIQGYVVHTMYEMMLIHEMKMQKN